MKKSGIALAVACLAGALVTIACAPQSLRREAASDGAFSNSSLAESACLQNSRVWGSRVIDERTMIVTDRANRPFIVHLSGGCVGLTDANRRIAFRTATNLSCLREGDQVLFRDPTLGGQSCFVRNVEPAAGPYASDDNRNIYRDYETRRR